jgi:hypothetical protein
MATIEAQVRRQPVRPHDTTGTLFIRSLSALALAEGRLSRAAEIADELFPRSEIGKYFSRAATSPSTTATGVGGALVLPGVGEILNLVRPKTVVGRLNLKRVPFVGGLAVGIAEPAFAWVREGRPIPAGRAQWSPASLPPRKVGGILVMTAELLRLASPEAESVVRNELVAGLTQFADAKFLSADAEVLDVSPAGVAAGATSTGSAGNVATDVSVLLGGFTDADNVAVVASPRSLVAMAAANLIHDGKIGGVVPVIASSAAGNRLIAIDTRRVLSADSGPIEVDVAESAALQMDSTPADPAIASTIFEPLWSQNLVGIRVIRHQNWLALPGAVRQVTAVSY